MKKIEIFDPAMCCPTGLCGASIDPELLRVSTIVNVLRKKGIKINRYNLSSDPQAFVLNIVVHELLGRSGVKILPITLLDGEVVKTSSYPSNKEIAEWLVISLTTVSKRVIKKSVIENMGVKND
jgi:hypothetical protein